ncbi:MAG TPA: hypothetical protein DEQ32_05575 [Gammaproteobacteria bacterium]|nr:hypothetical protein [Gammaproteobacteria bacterium]|tara:strand:+ start:4832 stop:5266 length:435 start_codon:yes stop_codon:yes gene_type:complete
MSKSRGMLLASFLTTDNEEEIMAVVQEIVDTLTLVNNNIFLLRLVNEPHKKIITYNASHYPPTSFTVKYYTMRLHRKKSSNTLYTINALNAAVAEQHEGKQGKDLRVDWSPYENSLLLTTGKNLQVHPLEVTKIFKLEPLPEEN